MHFPIMRDSSYCPGPTTHPGVGMVIVPNRRAWRPDPTMRPTHVLPTIHVICLACPTPTSSSPKHALTSHKFCILTLILKLEMTHNFRTKCKKNNPNVIQQPNLSMELKAHHNNPRMARNQVVIANTTRKEGWQSE